MDDNLSTEKIEVQEMEVAPSIKEIEEIKQSKKKQDEKEDAKVESDVAIEKKDNSENKQSADSKNLLIIIAVIIGIFALVFIGSYVYNNNNVEPELLDIEALHALNYEGELSEEEGIIYNGFSSVFADNLWWTDIQVGSNVKRIPLHYNPAQVEDVPIMGSINSSFNQGDTVYVAIDPSMADGNYVVAMGEISANVGQGIGRNSQGACVKEAVGCEERKILSCEDTQGMPVIELVGKGEAKVELSGSCIKVSGEGKEIIKAANRLLYSWYKVIGN